MPEDPETTFRSLAGLSPQERRKLMAVLERVHHGQEVQAIAEVIKDLAIAADSAQKLEKVLVGLLDSQPVLCVLETVVVKGDRPPMRSSAWPASRFPCRSTRRLTSRPCGNSASGNACWWRKKRCWWWACGPTTTISGPRPRERSSSSARTARTAKTWPGSTPQGRNDQIVSLDRPLCEQALQPGMSLVLHRNAPNWAISLLSKEKAQSKYHVPIDSIDTTLDDLAGLEPIAERLLEKIFIRAVFPELRDEFALDPLRGVILYSEKPGQGKTALVKALAREVDDLGRTAGFDFCLWAIQPNELKSKWHGQDANNVRDLAAAIRARFAAQAPDRRLVLWIYFDEVDSLGSEWAATSKSFPRPRMTSCRPSCPCWTD